MRRASAVLLALLATAGPAAAPARPAPPPPPAAASVDAQGFQLALPPYAFAFPRDHAAHPRYRTEWWYYTGHLRAGTRRFGYELTFFRVGMPPPAASRKSAWAAHDLVFEHLALTDESRGRFLQFDAARRAALGLAGADSAREHVWLDGASVELDPDGVTHRLRGSAPGFALDLALAGAGPAAVHGANGVSAKGPQRGDASHYYSLTRLGTRGRLVVGTDTLAVEGRSWMDHEFASSPAGTHAGWDWFALQLDDGRQLMLYRLRRPGGSDEPLSHGTLVERDGRTRTLALADYRIESTGSWTSPHTHGVYPSGWVVRVPGAHLELVLTPTLRDQEMLAASMGGIAYWEGSVRVRGTGGGPAVTGEGYVELTGYAGRPPFAGGSVRPASR